MKVSTALIMALASVLVRGTEGEYRVKVHPPIPPPLHPPHFKYQSPIHKGGGHRWNSNSLGPPRFHSPHPQGTTVHHHVPHRPTITVHHHGNPLSSHPKPHVHIHGHGPPLRGPPHSSHGPSHGPSHGLSHGPTKNSHFLQHHHHHHHLPHTGNVHRPPSSFKGPWKGYSGGGFGLAPGNENFHPSPPDAPHTQPSVVATHQSVDDNKGPIHTIPAPNLGPSGGHSQHHHHSSGGHGFSGGGSQGSGFQTGHGIGQGGGGDSSEGPYPNPVYGKPVTADLTYQEPLVPAQHAEVAPIRAHIPTITIQSSLGYQVHEHGIFENHVTSSPSPIGHGGNSYFAPDPDPSLPAPKVPFTTDPHSHPSNGQAPPDIEQEIPQHLLNLYGLQQQNQHLQPQVEVQLQPQHHIQLQSQPQLLNVGVGGGGEYSDLGGQLLLAQALAQYNAQTQPETFQQVQIHQQQPAHLLHNSLSVHQVPPAPVRELAPSSQFHNSAGVSVEQVPLVATAHETIYPSGRSPHHHQGSSVSDGHGGHLSAYDLFANSPVESPVLNAIREDFHHQPYSSTTAAGNNLFRYNEQFPSTTPAPVAFSVVNGHDFQQQFPSITPAPISFSAANGHDFQQQFPSSTPAPVAFSAVNGHDFQQQFPTSTPAPISFSAANGHDFQQQFPTSTPAPVAFSAVNGHEIQQQSHGFDIGALGPGQDVTELYQNLGAASLSNHQAHGVSVTNPGQAGYISSSYHNQVSGDAGHSLGQALGVYRHPHDSSASETRSESPSVATAGGETQVKSGAISDGYSDNHLEGSVTKKKAGAETVLPSSSSFYSGEENASTGVDASSSQEEEDGDYYEETVPQEVDSEYERRPANAPPALPSGYGVYESYGGGKRGNTDGKSSSEDDRRQQEYDQEGEEEYEDYSDETKDDQKDEPSSSTHKESVYDRSVAFGTRLKPKRKQ